MLDIILQGSPNWQQIDSHLVFLLFYNESSCSGVVMLLLMALNTNCNRSQSQLYMNYELTDRLKTLVDTAPQLNCRDHSQCSVSCLRQASCYGWMNNQSQKTWHLLQCVNATADLLDVNVDPTLSGIYMRKPSRLLARGLLTHWSY